jgi:hypothetical protein
MNGFGVTDEELELARQAGIRAAVKYGDDVGSQLDKIRAGQIWNDHVAVQGAIEAIKAIKQSHG